MADLTKLLDGVTLIDGGGERWTPIACQQQFLVVSRDKARPPVWIDGRTLQKLAEEQPLLRRTSSPAKPKRPSEREEA
jgi:hypothetical protein